MDTPKIDFDKLRKDSWSTTETQNVQLVIDFMQKLMNNHEFDHVLKEFGNSYYTQHNRSIPDGMEALIDYVKGFVKRFPDYSYDVKHVHADGDYVIFHSQITTSKKDRGNDKKGINVSDTWKIQNNLIVEHWDTLQPMNGFMRFFFWLTGGKVANANGVY
ncbi:nuclear transport factor 2 family protein [Sediminitomix flava]|uniref:Putative SnoaL-like aldol condensation-catalyzing enzyme n=1 Tax=Sediminitomix flava TaxID=379075 RepID=A0A315ZBV1_SEDFL|nr:nuclear transport factor 2 family protein [Sediminitomix flava]PWJ42639.1 putative SnoaL-like aldol condensation-catalyzing enzyme [Sediminitomix flava]